MRFIQACAQAVVETVISIADQCDGVRCDMAMLFMTPIFEQTWGDRAGPRPDKEYWTEVTQRGEASP